MLNYLQACSISRQFVLGSLTFVVADQTSLICRREGAVVQPLTSDSPALNVLRLQKRASASGDFVLLNQKIDELTIDPFYTTKPVEKGTGLGLSISYQIVTDKHKGQLHYFSQPEEGTEFIIEIPIN